MFTERELHEIFNIRSVLDFNNEAFIKLSEYGSAIGVSFPSFSTRNKDGLLFTTTLTLFNNFKYHSEGLEFKKFRITNPTINISSSGLSCCYDLNGIDGVLVITTSIGEDSLQTAELKNINYILHETNVLPSSFKYYSNNLYIRNTLPLINTSSISELKKLDGGALLSFIKIKSKEINLINEPPNFSISDLFSENILKPITQSIIEIVDIIDIEKEGNKYLKESEAFKFTSGMVFLYILRALDYKTFLMAIARNFKYGFLEDRWNGKDRYFKYFLDDLYIVNNDEVIKTLLSNYNSERLSYRMHKEILKPSLILFSIENLIKYNESFKKFIKLVDLEKIYGANLPTEVSIAYSL
jgi:hypothetical protein